MKLVTVIHAAFEKTPVVVAKVKIHSHLDGQVACEYAYRWTNNVLGSWSRKEKEINGYENGDFNEDVEVIKPIKFRAMGLRSTSMGDYMLFDGKKYEVDMAGFKEIANG